MESVDRTYQQYLPSWLFNTAPSLDFMNWKQTGIKSKVYHFIFKYHLYRKLDLSTSVKICIMAVLLW